jgi:hypothetical protein
VAGKYEPPPGQRAVFCLCPAERAFAAGYSNVPRAASDSDLECIRQDPRYLALVALPSNPAIGA